MHVGHIIRVVLPQLFAMPSGGGGGAIVLLGPTGVGLEPLRAARSLKCASDGCPPWLERPRPTECKYNSTMCLGVRHFLVGWL